MAEELNNGSAPEEDKRVKYGFVISVLQDRSITIQDAQAFFPEDVETEGTQEQLNDILKTLGKQVEFSETVDAVKEALLPIIGQPNEEETAHKIAKQVEKTLKQMEGQK